ncbi:unnamed protein product [Diatraea saccharalis]|uniref:trypsin n=1 Tax=Diatraea saccharalis TaxID=40085 RepID=A0A9N9WJ29_9NEOP|nr:unnamed protein product [Diatraea saccharalis]
MLINEPPKSADNVKTLEVIELNGDKFVNVKNLEPAVYKENEYTESVEKSVLRTKSDYDDTNQDDGDDIKALLEEKYKFKNDEISTRFRISNDDRKSLEDKHIALAFRSYAVRRIVGGMETSISMYPYNVAISRNGKHWCGGSIIDEQWVLTAGHCLESAFDGSKKKLQPFIVRAGSSFHNRGGYQARVNKVFFPKDYAPGSADYDYSLLRLDRPMPIGRNIAVLNLPSKDYAVKEEDILLVTGWGSTDHDSGGPAVRDGVLLGIVSFGGKQCGDPRSPGVYSKASEVTNWVENTITANEASTVPELLPKIKKARQREKELQKFKARVEDKKNKIKNWLRETLKSPSFIALAKKKLKEAGFRTRRNFAIIETNNSALDDKMMDEINLSNMINDWILDEEGGESEKLLKTLALQDVMLDENSAEESLMRASTSSESVETLIAIISAK